MSRKRCKSAGFFAGFLRDLQTTRGFFSFQTVENWKGLENKKGVKNSHSLETPSTPWLMR